MCKMVIPDFHCIASNLLQVTDCTSDVCIKDDRTEIGPENSVPLLQIYRMTRPKANTLSSDSPQNIDPFVTDMTYWTIYTSLRRVEALRSNIGVRKVLLTLLHHALISTPCPINFHLDLVNSYLKLFSMYTELKTTGMQASRNKLPYECDQPAENRGSIHLCHERNCNSHSSLS